MIRPDGPYTSLQRIDMYRWHVLDPIHFERDLTVDVLTSAGAAAGGT